MTHREQYLAAGIALNPNGTLNNYQWVKLIGRLGSRKDHTWVRDVADPRKGHHSCCGSKRDYYHKTSCKATTGAGPDDLSDLKDIA